MTTPTVTSSTDSQMHNNIMVAEDIDPEQAQRDKDRYKNLALIAKYFKKIYKPTNNNLRTSLNSRNKNVDTTSQYKNDNQSGQFGNQRTVNVAGARENVGSPVVQQSGIQCFNCKEFGHFAKEYKKPKRVKDSAYHKEKMFLCKQVEQAHYSYMAKIQEVPTADLGTDSEPLEHAQNDAGYNVFSNELQHFEQSESISNTCLVETDDSNVIPDSPDMCEDDIQNDQNDVESDDEHNDSFIFVHELKQEMHADLKYVESLEIEIDKLESDKAEFSNMYDMILQEKKHLISLEIALQKCKEQVKNDTVWSEKASNVFRKEREQYIEIQDLKAQLQDKNIAISELKKLIEKGKGKYVDTKFDKPSVVRQPNAQWIPKPSVLGLSKPVTAQTLPQTARQAISNTNVLKPGMYRIDNRTKKSNVVPISTRKPKGQANKSVATPHKKKVASKSTNQKPQSYYRMFYEKTSKTWKWWIEQQSTLGYKWVPKTKMQWVSKAKNENVQKRIVQLILFIVDSGCTKHMTGNLKLLCNFVEKFMGTVRFGNDQFAPILGYGDLVQGNIMINRVYYVEGLNQNLFSVDQFCDADLEVAFWKSTCFVRDLQGNDLLNVEVYVAQPNGFVDPDHPEKVYHLRKALYGLKQAPRAWYDELLKFLTSKGFTKGLQIHQSPRGIFINQAKYALEILHKHGMEKGQSLGTPMATKSKLDADLSEIPVGQTDYRSKIGSLMYLTSSRPDIVQAGSSFDLTDFSDADHAGCIDTRKSTSGGIQFLGDKLVSWMSKKHDCTAMSSAEAEYVATEYQLADMFTKALPEDRFKYLVRRIGMRCLTPAELEVLAKESA
nr:integrase, catalytic region, zinc finger, CCHC-type, peptidase aspartic, catalytic [Tanacetum cinerariifolium]